MAYETHRFAWAGEVVRLLGLTLELKVDARGNPYMQVGLRMFRQMDDLVTYLCGYLDAVGLAAPPLGPNPCVAAKTLIWIN